MKKTPLAILSAIVIGVSMVFAFAGVRHTDLPQDTKVAAPVVSPDLDAVSMKVAVNDAPGATLIAPMDMQVDILINESPLMLGTDSPAPEVSAEVQPVVDDTPPEILTAGRAASDSRNEAQVNSSRSVQEALADMLTALDRLSQQAAATRKSVIVLVSQYDE